LDAHRANASVRFDVAEDAAEETLKPQYTCVKHTGILSQYFTTGREKG
jgi:hypothetical protein